MKTPLIDRCPARGVRRRLAWPAAAAFALLAFHGQRVDAATTVWTGAAGNGLWSDAGNWSGGVPTNGDTIVYGTSGGGDSFGNLSLSLASFRYAPAILPEHNFHLIAGALLTLTGFGIDNVSRIPGFGQPQIPSGVIRQQLFMDAGSTMIFQNSATIGGSDPVFNLPVDLNALGGTTVGGSGGRIVFEDNSTASGPPANTFTGLRVAGGTVAGASGGELLFRENANMGFTASFAVFGGDVAGALGGTVIFEGNAVASAGSNSNLTGGGLGGRVIFRENARSIASINNSGAGTLEAGNEAVTQFLDDAGLDGLVWNFAGQDIGMQGGRTEFRQRAAFGGTTGGAFIINGGSSLGGEGGRTVFYDDTRIAGTGAIISNQAETEGITPGGIGGVTEFLGNSRAGAATIYNSGASSSAAGTLGGRTLFRENSSAESATISAGGGSGEVGAVGGSVEFSGAATAANAAITAQSGNEVFPGLGSGLGGRILFSEMASGGAASVTVELGGVFDMSALTTAGTTLGSIAGAGEFFLGSKALTVGSNNSSTVVAGVISDGGQGGGTGASLTKVGTGTLELGGLNTYTGATNVNAGTLLVTGALGNGAVSIAGNATLGGTGTIGGAVTVADGGIVAPGKTGAGTLTVGALTLNAASILNYQLGSASDRIDVNGALTLDGAINVSAGSGLTAGVYRLLNYAGTFTNNLLVLGTVPAGTTASDFSIQTDVVGQVNLVLNGGAGELLFWDGPNFASNAVINGGTSTWTNAPTNWTNSGGTINQAWASQKAVFSGAAGTVTLGENVTTTGLQFVTSGYVVNAGAGQAIALNGSAVIRVDALASATINAALTGGALNKDGDGTLVLTASNSYAGGTTLTNGTIVVRNAAGLGLGTGPVAVLASPTTILRFENNASVGAITITNDGSGPALDAGFIQMVNTAHAGTATITNRGNTAVEGIGGILRFDGTSYAEIATIENLGAGFASSVVPGFETTAGGQTWFSGSALASAATITNRGGQNADLLGGRTLFFESSSAAQATLIVEGGSNGGLGGTIRFTGSATGGTPRVIFQPGGAADGRLEISGTTFTTIGIGSIEGNGQIALGAKRIEVGGNNLETEFSGVIDGFGGSLRKVGTAMLTLAGSSSYTGGTTVADGVLRVTNPTGLALGTGPVFVNASLTSELRFSFSGSAGALAITNASGAPNIGVTSFRSSATAATATITNNASTANGAFGGRTEFYATATAANATINNFGTSFTGNTLGAEVFFYESSTAGAATIINGGGYAANAEGGQANFFGNSSAGTASITNYFANVAGAFPGAAVFRGSATAGGATILNLYSAVPGASGGVTEFFDSATGGTARITLEGGFGNGALASVARFFNTSSADRAEITVEGSRNGTGAAGLIEFFNSATAGDATVRNKRATGGSGGGLTKFGGTTNAGTSDITNEGAQIGVGSYGFTEFRDTATAQAATFHNGASLTSGTFGGRAIFYLSSKAGTALFDNEGSKVTGGYAGEVFFFDTASAEASTILNRGSTAAAATQGSIAYFFDRAKAGTATITNEGSAFAPNGGVTSGGQALFGGTASAEQAAITNRSRLTATGSGGTTLFDGTSATVFATAAQATITNDGGLFAFQPGGQTTFQGFATAGAATLVNRGGVAINAFGGNISFLNATTAGTATITNEGGAAIGADGGFQLFGSTSRAGSSTIVNRGGEVAGAFGGVTFFFANSTADNATLRALPGLTPDSSGRFVFADLSEGGTARVILEGSGAAAGRLFVNVSDSGMGIGSIEGSGQVSLQGKNLTVGSNNLSTLFSGVIAEGGAFTGGSLTKVGTGTLELSGANTYAGLTQVSGGVLRISGSIAGTVQVNNGGTLGGNGTISGGITVGPGGVVNPGASIGTVRTLGLLEFGTGSVFGLEIDSGAGTADRISAVNVTIGTGVNLFGQEIGAGTLPLGLQFKIIDNTSPDLTMGFFAGLDEGAQFAAGNNLFAISYQGGDGNDVTLTNLVPEPGSAGLVALGTLLVSLRRPRRSAAR